jgi:Vitamin K-dependent gamma-carboxylase
MGARLADAWERFWFEPEPVSTLALVRLAFGLLVFVWALSLVPDLEAFFGAEGVAPLAPEFSVRSWGVLAFDSRAWLAWVLLGVLLAASLALAVGYRPRLAAILVLVGVLSFEQRNGFVFNAGDSLIRVIAFYLVLAPGGAGTSLFALRRAARSEIPAYPRWPLRLLQVQLSVIYLASVWEKLHGETWRDGSAVAYVLRISDLTQVAAPAWLTSSEALTTVLTYGTLGMELGLAVLVWNRRLRPWVLGAGAVMHIAFSITLAVGYFSAAMLILYLAFVPPEGAARLLSWRSNRHAIPV